jgi:transposase-like protein
MDIKEASFHYLCRNCGRPVKVALPTTNRGYSDKLKRECLKIYVNGIGRRAIERGHCVFIIPTIITWLKAVEKLLPDAYTCEQIPDVSSRG